VDVCLVNMPRSGVTRPSLGLGILKALLLRAGIEARVLHPCLWFVEFAGPWTYEVLTRTNTEECLFDWIFAEAAFPEQRRESVPFLDALLHDRAHPLPGDEADLRARLLELRRRAPDFVDWTAQRVLEHAPRIVGCSSVFEQHVASLALLRRIRELAPRVVTLMGGANCETIMGRTTHEQFAWVDFVVSGEAEEIIVDLCRRIAIDGREVPADKVPAAVFAPVHREVGYPRSPGGDGHARGTTRDLRKIPLPDFDDFFHRELPEFAHRDRIRPSLVHESSRGCWWGAKHHCTFCGLNGDSMDHRTKPPEQVEAELRALSERYGVDRVQMADNIIALSYFDTLLPRLAAWPRPPSIFYETKANLEREQLRRFRRAGVRWIQPGMESLHTGVLRLMRKGVAAWQNLRLLKWCREEGIAVAWSVIAGFPGEEDAWYGEMARFIPWLEHLQPGRFSHLRFDRYSPHFRDAEAFGLALEPCPAFREVYPLPDRVLADLVYFFCDRGRDLMAEIRGGARPGARAVFDAMNRWSRPYETLPELVLEQHGAGGTVRDERSCAVAARHRLDALDLALLRACDAAPARGRLAERVGLPEQDLARRLAELLERRLVLPVDGRVLSLVLESPRPLPDWDTLPAGTYSVAGRPRPQPAP